MSEAPLETVEYRQKEKRLLRRILIGVVVFLLIAALISYLFTADHYTSLVIAIAIISTVPCFFLVEKSLFRLALYFACAIVVGITCLTIIFEYGTINKLQIGYLILLVPIGLLAPKKIDTFLIIGFMLLLIPSLFWAEQNGYLGEPVLSNWNNFITIYLVVILSGLGYFLVMKLGMLQQKTALSHLESQYKRLFDNIPIGLYRTTVEGHQLRANPALWMLEGYSSEEESIADVFDIGDEWYVDKDRRAAFIREMEEFGRVINFESQIYHRISGEKIWISESAYTHLDVAGNILFYEGSVQDITQRKQYEEKLIERAAELKQLSDNYQSVTNAARDVIIQTDADGVITFANPAVNNVFGYHPKDVIGENISTFIHESERAEFWSTVTKKVGRPKADSNFLGVQAKGVRKTSNEILEEILIEITLSDRVNVNGQRVYTAIIRDVTDREKTAEFLDQMQRLDSLGLLAGGIAHDFNNLLVAILGQTSVALRKLPPDNKAVNNLLKVKAAGLQAADLCRQLLAYSGKGHFEIQQINLNELIAENISLHKIAIPSTIKLRTKFDDCLPLILGDRSQIQQIVMNLLINAAEALGDKPGEIILSTEHGEIGGRDSLLWTRSGTPLEPGKYSILHVTDNGPGMDKETLNRIFEPFFTTKVKGNGLGLSAVQGIIRGHKGSLLVHSTLTKGTTFSIYFPVTEDVQMPASVDKKPVASVRGLESVQELEPKVVRANLMHTDKIDKQVGEKQCILVIDDQDDVRRACCDMLQMLGFDVLESDNGFNGIDMYKANRDCLDLVLLDYNMPRMNGKDALEQLRKINPNLPIIMYSGYAEGMVPRQSMEEKPVGFLAKPFTADVLQQMIKKHIG